jgi:Fur family peroxide stress response transcriptional regulator
MSLLNDFIEVLHREGLKATAQRIEISRILNESRTHPSAEEVYREVKKKFPTISPATVYKTIRVLKKAGKVRELAFYDKKTRFNGNMQPHIHLICLRCNRIEDVIDRKVKDSLQHFSDKLSFKIEGERIDLYGICRECQAQS